MSPVYTVKAVRKIADGKSDTGPWTRQKLRLVNGDGAFTDVVAFFGKYQPPVPNPGDTLECEIGDPYKPGQLPQVVWPKKAGGGGGFKGRSQEEIRAIAMQASHKVAVDIIRLAIDTKRDPADVLAEHMRVARSLFDQIQEQTGSGR